VDGRRIGLARFTVCDQTGGTVVRCADAVVPKAALSPIDDLR
jgi:hypothetical protein